MTRRDWKPTHAAHFHAGDLVDAWNRSPRAGRDKGARKVATIRLVADPREVTTRHLSPTDYEREGFRWFQLNGTQEDRERVDAIWREWLDSPRLVWVVEFELVEVLGVESASERARPERGSSASTFAAEDRAGRRA
jgi:hypothetical protein